MGVKEGSWSIKTQGFLLELQEEKLIFEDKRPC